MTENFDAIIIGSGQGGNPLAGALAAAGKKTALVERQDVGGTCINRGCTPTKTMVASARVAYLARRAGDYGVDVGRIAIDMGRVRERKRKIVSQFRESREKWLDKAQVELIRGEASFTGPRTIRVALHGGGERQLTAPQVFIGTGTRAAVPPIAGLDTVPYLDNASIMELDHVPEHLLVLGGGYVGVEFSQMFRRFGSKVTVIQSGPQLLRGEDPDVAAEVLKILRQDGIEVLLNTRAQKVARANGGISLELDGRPQTIEGSDLLVATGRVPNTGALEPAAGGVETGRAGFYPGQRSLGDLGPRRLRHWRREGRACVHPHLLRRFSDSESKSARRRRPHDARPDGSLHRFHGSAVGPCGDDGERSAAEWTEDPRSQDADELGRAGP